MQEGQHCIDEVEQEHQFAADNVSRLEENLRCQDQELAEARALLDESIQNKAELEVENKTNKDSQQVEGRD